MPNCASPGRPNAELFHINDGEFSITNRNVPLALGPLEHIDPHVHVNPEVGFRGQWDGNFYQSNS